MIALVAATEHEARPLIASLGATKMADAPFQNWRAVVGENHRQVRLIVSGVGKVAAAAASANLLSRQDVDLLVNFGLCGVLVDREDLRPGVICRVRQVFEGDHLGIGGRPIDPIVCHQLPGSGDVSVDLVTTDRPVFDTRRRKELAVLGQVVDMEGAAVARSAAWYGVPCTLIKGVSDPAGTGDRSQLQANLEPLAESLAQQLLSVLAHVPKGPSILVNVP